MLDIMRRKKRLKAVLWLVIISLGLGMVLFFVPGANIGIDDYSSSAASVDGDVIAMKDYILAHRRLIENYTDRGRNRIDRDTLRALGLGSLTLESLIKARVTDYIGKQLGIDVSPEEISRAVETHAGLQDQGGGFIGVDRYKALLAANNISTTEFERGLRQMLLESKIRRLITDSILITEQQLKDEFLRVNQEATMSFVLLQRDDFTKRVSPSEADLRSHFDAHKDDYSIKEHRRTQYLLISLSALAATIEPTEQEIRQEWDLQGQEEIVDAAHILFEVADASKDEEVRTRAEAVLKQARAGEDFAQLARKYSEDTGTAEIGGNLGPFIRGRMVKEFEDVAFALKPGEISGLVRTQYGYHIIKVLRHEIPSLENSRESLALAVQHKKASELAKEKGAEAQRLAESEKDLTVIARALGEAAEINETPLLSRDSASNAEGISQSLLDEIFQLKAIDTIGRLVEIPGGFALPKLLEVQLARPPDFAESRAKVEADYIRNRAAELMASEAQKLSEEASKQGDIHKAAQSRKLTVKTTPPFKQGESPDLDLGVNPQVMAAAFNLPVGGVSAPIALAEGERTVVLQVKSLTPLDESAFNAQKEELRQGLLNMRQDTYFEEYVRRITEDLDKRGKIIRNPKAIEQVEQISYY